MWEIFSYYGMRSLLVYYMTKQLMIGQEKASLIYGTYTAMAYFTPIFGGVIADRWLGKRRAVIIGGSIMAAGHFMMTFEPLFYLALATIALGNGLFLPSLPSQITDLYRPDDPRRSWAYNVYYVGINIGGFLAPLVCGTLGEFYGWHWGFGAAGVGMLAGLVIYILGGKYLPERGRVRTQRRDRLRADRAETSFNLRAAIRRRARRHGVSRRVRTGGQHRRAVGRRRHRSQHRPDDDTDDLVPVTESIAGVHDDARCCWRAGGAKPMPAAGSRRCGKWRSVR